MLNRCFFFPIHIHAYIRSLSKRTAVSYMHIHYFSFECLLYEKCACISSDLLANRHQDLNNNSTDSVCLLYIYCSNHLSSSEITPSKTATSLQFILFTEYYTMFGNSECKDARNRVPVTQRCKIRDNTCENSNHMFKFAHAIYRVCLFM